MPNLPQIAFSPKFCYRWESTRYSLAEMIHVQGYSTITHLRGKYSATRTGIPGRQLVRNAPPGRFSGKFVLGCRVARVMNPDCHVPPDGYKLYTCAVLFDDCTRVLVYTAWYLDTCTTAVLSTIPLDMCTTAVLSMVQLYGKVHRDCCTSTRRGTLVRDLVT
jgi:hypothetical protein